MEFTHITFTAPTAPPAPPAPPANAAQAKQIREMANNIVDLVAENSVLRKRNKILEQQQLEDSGCIFELLGRLSQASKYINS